MKAFAKVNIFLKITGTRGVYHELASRFMVVQDLYDEVEFFKKDTKEFVIDGEFNCQTQQNTIYKAYKALFETTKSTKLENFMQEYGVKVAKNIPSFAGLGGGSSDAATYLKMCNKELNLGLSIDKLAKIGAKVGADVPFFVYGYNSANVSGVGEIVEPFEEEALVFDIYTPKIEISTPLVYKTYREHFFAPIDNVTKERLFQTQSTQILEKFSPKEANDLFAPALFAYNELQTYVKEDYFFSGSGSSFFKRIK